MKSIDLKIVIQESKIATAIKTSGYDNNNMSDQLELLGIAENFKGIIQERIKQLVNVSGKI